MTKKDMSEKLLGTVRSAKTHSGTPSAPPPKLTRPSPGVTSGARPSEQTPLPNLDHPWENLHPERIWPD